MRITSIIVSFAMIMVYVDARGLRQSSNQILNAEDVGALHTDAFEKLAKMYAVKKPADKKDMMKDSYDILTSYCKESECEAYAKDATEEQFKISSAGPSTKLSYPEDVLDPKLQESLAKVNSIVATLKTTDDIEEIVSNLAAVKREVEDTKDVTETQKLVVLSAISVASESSKLWHGVYNNPNHALHGLHFPVYFSGNKGKRRLDEWWGGEDSGDGGGWWGGNDDGSEGGGWWGGDDNGGGSEGNGGGSSIDLVSIVLRDATAALTAGLQNITSGDPLTILSRSLLSAIPASLSALGGGGGGNN